MKAIYSYKGQELIKTLNSSDEFYLEERGERYVINRIRARLMEELWKNCGRSSEEVREKVRKEFGKEPEPSEIQFIDFQ